MRFGDRLSSFCVSNKSQLDAVQPYFHETDLQYIQMSLLLLRLTPLIGKRPSLSHDLIPSFSPQLTDDSEPNQIQHRVAHDCSEPDRA